MRSTCPPPLPRGSVPASAKAATAALLTVPLLLTGLATGTSAGAQAHLGRVPLAGTVPAWAAPSADRGEIPDAAPVDARVYLAGPDRARLAATATAVSDPTSRSYRHFLTAQQVARRFGAGPAQADAVRGWLTSAGFRVVGGTAHYLAVRGDARSVQRAFATRLHSYRKDGRTYRAPATAASVPAEVAAAVLSVVGLDDAPHVAHPDHTGRRDLLPPPSAANANSGPFSAYFGAGTATGTPTAYGKTQPFAVRGYTGAQLRHAYGADLDGLTGAGVTVAVVDAYDSPTIGDDAAAYAAAHHEQAYRPGQLTRVDAGQWTHTMDNGKRFPDGCGASGWYGEQTLDVEAVHGMAPDAAIVYAGAASCGDADLVDALQRIVDGHLADIVSNSWGEAENESDPALDPVYNDMFQRGATEGIGFYVSSGDDGDQVASSGTRQSDMPASLPWVTAVGGTSLATGDASGSYRFETGWGTMASPLSADGSQWGRLPGGFAYGAGGGTSGRIDAPAYQSHVVPDALNRTQGGYHRRVVPDVAAVADPGTGFLVGQTQTWPDGTTHYGEYRIGGTSLASPVFAGVQALAQQAAGGTALGFANPALYQRAASASFHDVVDHPLGDGTELAQVGVSFHNGVNPDNGTETRLLTMGHDSSLHATVGFDNVTGLGSPTRSYLRSFVPKAPGAAARPRG